MKLIRILTMLLLACGMAAGFPKTSPRTALNETFDGGADSFDLNLHSLTLMPYDTGSTQNDFRYPSYYNIRPIRSLPVDMSGSSTITETNGTYQVIQLSGLPTIHNIALNHFQITYDGSVILKNSNLPDTPIVTLNVLKSTALADSSGELNLTATYLQIPGGKLVIQFDYSLDPDYASASGDAARFLGNNTFQVEIFATGMIRYSYFSVDVTVAQVGLSSTTSSTTGGDLNFSNAVLRVPDLVTDENSGNAFVGLQLDENATVTSNFQYATRSSTAITPTDFTTTSGTGNIVTGTKIASIPVPLVNDTYGELAESLDLVIHSPGNPDWIFAEPRIWILDDDAPGAGSGPLMDRSGNRVIVLPPASSPAATGFRLLSLTGGTLHTQLDQSPLTLNSTFSLQAGAAGLIASGLGVHFTVEAIHSGGASAPVGFDLDGINPAPVFNFTSDRLETTEGGFASLAVTASLPEASISYQVFPLTALASTDYAPTPKTLEFKDGMAMIEVPVFADGVTEGNEEFLVRLINPSPGSFIGPASRARVVIADGSCGLHAPADQILPPPLLSGRVLNRHQTTASWRFVGEPASRPAFSHGWNLREGLHQVEFQGITNAWKLYMAPESYLYQSASNPPTITDLDVEYANALPTHDTSTTTSGHGSLQVHLLPAGTTGKWRRVGGAWKDSGAIEGPVAPVLGIPVGTHLVEFEDLVTGLDAPSIRPVRIQANQKSVLTATYQARPPNGVDPGAVVEPDFRVSRKDATWSNIPISSQTGNFKLSFEFKVEAGSLSWIGLSSSTVSAETGLAAALRANMATAPFAVTGLSGSTYAASTALTPLANQWYFAEFSVNPSNGTYSLYVTPSSGIDAIAAFPRGIRITANFRTATSEFNYLSMASSTGASCRIRSIRVAGNPAGPAAPAPTNSWTPWRTVEYPDQTGVFDLPLELQIRPTFFPSANPFQFLFALSDGRVIPPTFPSITAGIPQPTNLGASGRLAPVAITMRVNLINHTYRIIGSVPEVSGMLPAGLTRANHFHISASKTDITEFRIADTILPPAYAPPTGLGVNRVSDWIHIPITPQTGRFALTCEIRTVGETISSGDRIDSLLGLSSTKVDWWSNIAVALRAKLPASGSDFWDAYTSASGDFTQVGNVPVVDGKLYHATFHVDVPAKTFRISIAPDDGGPVVILPAGTFQHQATVLRYLTLRSVQGRLEVSNIRGPLPHPLDSPAFFTGQIETPNGFGTGTVVADHVVMTSARLVIDPATGNFFPRGITWRRSEGGYSVIPDACEPSHILLPAKYSATAINTPGGDSHDVALLVFRPLDVPDSENAPGGGCFSGFQIGDGSGGWTSAQVKSFPSFPVSGITAANLGKIHSTNLSTVSFGGAGLVKTASGIRTPPGTEGAAVFVQGEDKILRPAAVCIGAADGTPKFRTIDAEIAEAIYQANSYQRQPGFLQGLLKGGVYYINQKVQQSTEANRVHILSNNLPPTATWTVKRKYGLTLYGPTHGPFQGGLNFVAEPATYLVTLGTTPSGFTGPAPFENPKSLLAGTTWNLPAVYTPDPPASYKTWVDANYDEFEAASPVAAPNAQTPWLGVDNLTAYAFGFDPNGGTTPFATATTPGFPVVTVTPPTIAVDFLRRKDSHLTYEIQYSDTLAGWATIPLASPAIPLTGWERVSWTSPSLPGQPGRKFVRTSVTLTE